MYTLAVQADGKVLIGGEFESYNGDANAPNQVLRLNADGSLDTSFNYGGTGTNSRYVKALAVQADGKVLVGGYFTAYNGNAAAPDRLLRLNADGTLNNTATPLAGATFVFNPGNTAGNTRTVSTAGTYTATATDPATGATYLSNAVVVTVAAPTLSMLTPTSGPAGSVFDIAGTNLSSATAVTFTSGGTATPAPAGFLVAGNTRITGIMVPAGLAPGAYTVAVTTPGGTSNGLIFTVTAPACGVTALAQNGSVTLASDGTATVAASAVDNGSSSPCGPVTLAVVPATFTCANLGANQVTLTVTAADGSQATATASVTVRLPALGSTTWTGAVSTDWSDCRNWSYGLVPTAAINAMVPATATRFPTLPAGPFATNDLSVTSGATLTTDAGTTLQVSGNLSLDGATTFAGPVQLVGATTQGLGGQTAPGFSTVVVAKPAGTVVQLQRDLPIAISLILSSGTLATASYHVALGTSATLSETNASYVLGNVAATRTLAPGAAERFGGLGLTLTPAVGSLAPGLTPVVRTTGTVLTGVGSSQSIQRYFDIQPAIDQGLNVDLVFGYFEHELNNIPAANLIVFKSTTTAGPWEPEGPSGRTADAATASGTVRVAGLSSFSLWTLGNADNPLPVTLTNFMATALGNTAVRLAWTTASEVNSQVFEVERSPDGVSFDKIGGLAAAGHSATARSYALLDAHLPAGAPTLY